IGCSFPFRIAPDAYRAAFRAVMKGMYQQRCGTALVKPFTEWTRGLCHHPSLHPIHQSTLRYMEGHCDACKETMGTPETRDLWGGYHDAGDWDREGGHPEIPGVLALAYELHPAAFTDGELNIPESGNGLPDILDEARWGLDYYVREQRADGGVSVGLFMDSFPQPGEGPAADTGEWFCYASDPEASYKLAASAAHVAFALEKATRGDVGAPYVRAAARAWDWAETHQRPGDAAKVRDLRLHAAACLFRATGGTAYHDAFKRDLLIAGDGSALEENDKYDQRWAAWTYARTERKEADPALRARLRKAAVAYARAYFVETAAKRAGRQGGNIWRPLTWGFGTGPELLPVLGAQVLEPSPDFVTAMQTTCDFMLGANPLNMCWITGMGSRHPEMVFHPDSWYSPKGPTVAPGIVPEGPYRYEGEGDPKSGPWDPKWMHRSAYPPAQDWPP
ncbi:MAG: glycoside hydrolase family 9 protein, partial [bacterium]